MALDLVDRHKRIVKWLTKSFNEKRTKQSRAHLAHAAAEIIKLDEELANSGKVASILQLPAKAGNAP